MLKALDLRLESELLRLSQCEVTRKQTAGICAEYCPGIFRNCFDCDRNR